MASRTLVVVVALVFIQCVLASQLAEREARELFSRRQQLANMKRLMNEWDQQFAHMQKRSCDSNMNFPGARDACEAMQAMNLRMKEDFFKGLSALNGAGKRSACALGLGGFMDGCDAQSAMEALKAREFFNSLQSPGKRQVENDDSISEDSPRN